MKFGIGVSANIHGPNVFMAVPCLEGDGRDSLRV